MLFLLPVARYQVEYQIARGRPYSYYERCVLAAIGDGANSLEKLEEIFCVHPRIILEALVTLTQAGWLAVGNTRETGFALTHAGAAALVSNREPHTRQVDPKSQMIAMEALTGRIAPDSTVNSIHIASLGSMDRLGKRLPERVVVQTLNDAQVESFLTRRDDEWLLRIEKIALKARRMHWLPIEFNKSTRRFNENYPWYWRDTLIPALFEIGVREGLIDRGVTVKQFTHDSNTAFRPRDVGNAAVGEVPGTVLAAVAHDDFLDSNKKHEAYLRNVFLLSQKYILLTSAFLRAGVVETLHELIYSALQRGVTIDFLWGYNDGKAGGEGVAALKKIEFDAKKDKLKGRLNFNRTPTGSHAKISVFDRNSGYEATVGSYNWLSALPGATADPMKLANVSLRLTDPVLVSRLIRAVAFFWAVDERHLDEPPSRWRRIAASLEKAAAERPRERIDGRDADAEVSFLVDSEHGQWFRSALVRCEERLTIMSHRLGAAAQGRLSDLGGSADLKSLVLYGQSDIEDDVLREVSTALDEAGGTCIHNPRIHAKMVIADDLLCLGSYNFLSTDTFDRAAGSKEVSVLVKSARLAKYFNEFVNDEYVQK